MTTPLVVALGDFGGFDDEDDENEDEDEEAALIVEISNRLSSGPGHSDILARQPGVPDAALAMIQGRARMRLAPA